MWELEERKRNRDEASGGNGICVHVCVEITEVCGITINNPPPILAHKKEKGGGIRQNDRGAEAGS